MIVACGAVASVTGLYFNLMLRHTCHVASLVTLPLLMAACSAPGGSPSGPPGGGQAGRGGRGADGPVPVLITRVVQKPMPVILPAVGTVEATSSVQIRAQVTGQLSALHFAEGQEVEKGQPLFSLDSRPFLATLQQAEAVLARDAATLQNAQAQQARAENLFQRGLLARDQHETQRSSATALAATVAADKAALESARLNLQYADINSPISGRTGILGAHVGDLVRANDTTPLVVINQLSPVYVTFSVPGRYLADIRRYQAQKPLPVTAVTPTVSNPVAAAGNEGPALAPGGAAPDSSAQAASAQGLVSFIDNTVDPATGMIRLKGTFPNSDRVLWPGAFVRVTLLLTTDPNALVVPVTAVQASQDGQYVYVVKSDSTVEMRALRIERQQGDQVVVAGGVTAGEVVVTDGQLRLTPGARVTARGEPAGRRSPEGGRSGNQGSDSSGRPGGR